MRMLSASGTPTEPSCRVWVYLDIRFGVREHGAHAVRFRHAHGPQLHLQNQGIGGSMRCVKGAGLQKQSASALPE